MILKRRNKFVDFFDKNFTRGERVLFRLKKKINGEARPSSYPYVSGDSFRTLADHIHDETGTFEPSAVKRGDTVFVSNPLILTYLQTMHPQIKEPYILIEHNGDNSIDKSVADLLDEKIIRLYASLVIYAHEKIVPIPIGLENFHYYVNGIPNMFDKLRARLAKQPLLKKNRIFFFFNIVTNPKERGPAKEYFLRNSCMDTVDGMLPQKLHLKTLMKYKFIASPPGNGIESGRTWDALYLRTIPIVKDFVTMRSLFAMGIPLWIVKDWHELDQYGEDELAKKYDWFIEHANWEPLQMDFWIRRIKADQEMARASL